MRVNGLEAEKQTITFKVLSIRPNQQSMQYVYSASLLSSEVTFGSNGLSDCFLINVNSCSLTATSRLSSKLGGKAGKLIE